MFKLIMFGCLLVGCGAEEGGGSGGGGGGGGGSGGGGTCTEASDTCAGETICIGDACVAAFGRVYEIRDVVVQLPTTDGNGEAWDAGGGAPDLKATILVNGAIVAMSAEQADTFSATFAGPFDVQLIAGSTLDITIVDVDLSVDDPAFTCLAKPLTAELLRGRSLACTAGATRLAYEIDPR